MSSKNLTEISETLSMNYNSIKWKVNIYTSLILFSIFTIASLMQIIIGHGFLCPKRDIIYFPVVILVSAFVFITEVYSIRKYKKVKNNLHIFNTILLTLVVLTFDISLLYTGPNNILVLIYDIWISVPVLLFIKVIANRKILTISYIVIVISILIKLYIIQGYTLIINNIPINNPIPLLNLILMTIVYITISYSLLLVSINSLCSLLYKLPVILKDMQEINDNIIKDKNEQIAIDSEIALARKLQRAILPTYTNSILINNIEIYGLTESASTINGDYHDIIEIENGILIGIGDITSHGLISGLIMLNIQAIIKILSKIDQYKLSDIIDKVNTMLIDISTKWNNHKKISTLMLAKIQGYKLTLTGYHESVIIVRNNKVHRINTKTLGTFIGFMHNIEHLMKECVITLRPGDLLIFYTDGLIEFVDKTNEEFSVDKFIRIIKDADPKKQIETLLFEIYSNTVLNKLDSNEVDDTTLLLVRIN